MNRKNGVLLTVILAALLQPGLAQPLFTFGNHQADKKEFLTAFNRSPDTTGGRRKALDKYLPLFINYKLKVQAAYDERLNNNSSFKIEADNFKKQIAESIINEEANEKALVKEAFERGKKDILVQQLFIEYGQDTASAWQKIQTAWQQLKKGKDFDQVVVAFASNEETKKSEGYIGYITAFTIPYEIENIIYTLPVGGFSAPYKNQTGYHIFKCVNTRPALGTRRVSQILLAFPPTVTDADKQKIALLADTLYARIEGGESFDELAKKYSSDNASATDGGLLPEISVGQYSSDFENKVFSLKQENEITAPFETSYGYHIVKLVKIIAAGDNSNETAMAELLKQKTESSDRLDYARQKLVKKWLLVTSHKKAMYDEKELWIYLDSSINHHSLSSFKMIKGNTVLFSFARQKIVVNDFLKYLHDKPSSKKYPVLLKEFTHQSCGYYYRDHLEEYNTVMRQQVKEFNDANLLFTAMDLHVWSKAGEDTAGLRNYYNEHQSKYTWAPGAAALIITATSRDIAANVADKIRNNPENWRTICSSFGVSVAADSGRYENNQLPMQQKMKIVKRAISLPEKNNNDGSYSFEYITEVFTTAAQRSLEDAKGMVINDYQQVLEAKWLAELRKKNPVKVNESVWKTVR
jgi:peptidyl-prolyl cis-trans isomerase SurA